ncbi:DinB family protein [Rhodobacteraceae bacterium B1Z28]|uniref:DinB family protein n=1 Tax=Ruegeria haliotis TaxID=2747601 RepID=A0ABX2PMB5_9RHOB|nr:DinB family protein [Ruegeria haliotis]NVO55173.1 DinB family protein [Ruegeria haliotis]
MITGSYAREMARYNHWQNKQLAEFLQALTPEELIRDRGAFFGSIMGTANHLLWGDWMWMSRFDKGPGPQGNIHRAGGGIHESVFLCPDLAAWLPLRETVDARISGWAEALGDVPLTGSFTWYSAAKEGDVTMPYAHCVIHLFNHQTHHRGQLHKMLTETGSEAPVSDLVFMPQEV